MTPDPISVASARLYAAGVDSQERLVALKFLGVLMASADGHGRVSCDPDDLVGLGLLHGLEPQNVDRSRRWLEVVSVLERRDDAWVIAHFSPVGPEVPPADAMDAIARALGRPLPAGSGPEPVAVPVVPVGLSQTSRRHRRWAPVVPAGVVAAAAAVIILLLAGPASVRLPSQTASNVRSNAQARRSAARKAQSTATSRPVTVSAAPAPAAPFSAPESASTQAPAASTPVTVPCPSGNVTAVVEQVSDDVEQSPPSTVGSKVTAALPPLTRTTVTGLLRSTASASVTVDPFPVDITFTNPPDASSSTVTARALAAPVTVPAGRQFSWSVSVDGPPHDPGSASAQPKLGAWRWADAAVAATCPPGGPGAPPT